ncbi:hypothetical protein ACEO96_04855 [Vibrio anguillarum]|uniref:hypothetical protein n=1 Tax=Vibrio anguillarum TaxID=55601 RepID=UPI003594308F
MSALWPANRKPVTTGNNPCSQELSQDSVGYYSEVRPHQYNGGFTPNESEWLFWQNYKTVANFR